MVFLFLCLDVHTSWELKRLKWLVLSNLQTKVECIKIVCESQQPLVNSPPTAYAIGRDENTNSCRK